MSDEQLDALLHGWLTAVDENGCAAQLRDYADNSIPLRFPESLRDDVLRLATRYVEIRGTGWLNGNDRWTSVDRRGDRPGPLLQRTLRRRRLP